MFFELLVSLKIQYEIVQIEIKSKIKKEILIETVNYFNK